MFSLTRVSEIWDNARWINEYWQWNVLTDLEQQLKKGGEKINRGIEIDRTLMQIDPTKTEWWIHELDWTTSSRTVNMWLNWHQLWIRLIVRSRNKYSNCCRLYVSTTPMATAARLMRLNTTKASKVIPIKCHIRCHATISNPAHPASFIQIFIKLSRSERKVFVATSPQITTLE